MTQDEEHRRDDQERSSGQWKPDEVSGEVVHSPGGQEREDEKSQVEDPFLAAPINELYRSKIVRRERQMAVARRVRRLESLIDGREIVGVKRPVENVVGHFEIDPVVDVERLVNEGQANSGDQQSQQQVRTSPSLGP